MDSLKLPKGGNNSATASNSGNTKTTSSVPITVRFNAGDECIEGLFQQYQNSGHSGGSTGGNNSGGADSLSTSPSQHHQQTQNAEELNSRNFLQGNFFNRKRSGSIEGLSPTSSGPNLIAALSSSGDSGSVGTWKLIKGKVSQTIEDIKSSKGSNPSSTIPHSKSDIYHEPDSDQENATVNSSISEDLPLDQELKQQHSDSDVDCEILLEGDVERSRLKRGLANLRSKVKAKTTTHNIHYHHHQQQQPQITLTTAAPTSSAASTAPKKKLDTIFKRNGNGASTTTAPTRTGFLRRRHKQTIEGAELAVPANSDENLSSLIPNVKTNQPVKKKGIIEGKKIVEIESGVEMLEDMIPHSISATDLQATPSVTKKREFKDLPSEEDLFDSVVNTKLAKSCTVDEKTETAVDINLKTTEILLIMRDTFRVLPTSCILGLIVINYLPIYDFLKGALSTLLFIGILQSLTELTQYVFNKFISVKSEKSAFEIPDYSKMPICEIPVIEEHKNIKSYKGWMCEINSYDPDKFQISMTKTVYVKLEGTMLKISNSLARIPRRALWNEPPIDHKIILFTNRRSYNLLGCRIELLPLGLARKRYFNRKYPIQLIIKCQTEQLQQQQRNEELQHQNSANTSKRPSNSSIRDNSEMNSAASVDSRDSKENKQSDIFDDNRMSHDFVELDSEMDFAATILSADLQTLQDPDTDLKGITMPCGDEERLLLFARTDREKEDWYRRFVAASNGEVHDQDLRLPNIKLINEKDLQAAAVKAALKLTDTKLPNATSGKDDTNVNIANVNVASSSSLTNEDQNDNEGESQNKEVNDDGDVEPETEQAIDNEYEGLLISSCAARNQEEYIKFMALYQHRRARRQAADLWKGIDQSLFLGPSGSVVWTNVLIGRFVYSVLTDNTMLLKIQEFLQKKLSSIKLPPFMEDVVITNIDLGNTPPLVHRISQPLLDERGTWVDADVTYEGLAHITVTTKLNLLRLKRSPRPTSLLDTSSTLSNVPPIQLIPEDMENSFLSIVNDQLVDVHSSSSAIYDSDAESSGGSSTESESPVTTTVTETATANNPSASSDFSVFHTSPGNARRIFKIVDRITASNLFQYATEISYVQKAMENMSANITLKVEIKGLVARATVNIPPPPSDRVWLAFRGPPRLWITAKPAFGDKSVDWSIVTSVIESKLCESVNKFLVYPNMVDVTIPILGRSTYQETN
ncbi:uncharacterized protein LOC119683624 isoform X2 [Teleopsis dalmanni]|uniref:uncharacterized protein LOC119683624 isoform X2 n=1 Tax=Teleopsis dalmanni TaxID=139649 RepID=UPI0018CF1DA9|nr:uncharacterized protein LOC119683624 isoform X2 [Teleopsis dalmanni]